MSAATSSHSGRTTDASRNHADHAAHEAGSVPGGLQISGSGEDQNRIER